MLQTTLDHEQGVVCPGCGMLNPAQRSECEKCKTALKPLESFATVYRQELLKSQAELPTKSSEITGGILMLLGMIGKIVMVVVVVLIVRSLGLSLEKTLGPLGMLLGPIGIFAAAVYIVFTPLVGLFRIGRGLFASAHDRVCPYCGQAYQLLNTQHDFICTGCKSLLRIPKNATSDLVKIHCPKCGAEWGTTADRGKATCHSCGVSVEIAGGKIQVIAQDGNCSNCGNPLSIQSYFCTHCGQLVSQPYLNGRYFLPLSRQFTEGVYADDSLGKLPTGMSETAVMANSAVGFLTQAVWLGKLTAACFNNDETTQLSLINQIKFLTRIERGTAYLNLALEIDPRLLAVAQEVLAAYDQLLIIVLKHTINWQSGEFWRAVQFSNSSNYTTDTDKFLMGDESTERRLNRYLESLPQEHNYLLDRLSVAAFASDLPVPQLWPVPLYQFTSQGEYTNKTFQILGWDNLRQNNWLFQQDETPMIPELRMPKLALDLLSNHS
jgi:hypothetical protein